MSPTPDEQMRLNRFLARAGVASRRKSDLLIQQGQVQVNGRLVAEPWYSVVVGRDQVVVGGYPIALPEQLEYILFYKPRPCLVARRDQQGRTTVFDLVKPLRPGTVAVGRLDQNTTGALLLTDDGELAFRLMHPRFEIEKNYQAVVAGKPAENSLETLRRGIELEDGWTGPARIQTLGQTPSGARTRLAISIHQGRKRQIRRMFAAIGHPVKALERICFAGLELNGLKPGQWRQLESGEIRALHLLSGLEEEKKCPAPEG